MEEPAHLTIVSGPEAMLSARAVRSTVARVQQFAPEAERIEVVADDPESTGVLLNAMAPSLFGSPTVLVVSDLADASDPLYAALKTGLDNITADVWVVVVHSGARNKKWLDELRDIAVLGETQEIVCAEVKAGAATRKLLEAEAKAEGRKITPDAVAAMVEAVGQNTSLLLGSMTQLLSDNPKGDITAKTVTDMFPWFAKIDTFKVADALWEGRGEEALTLLRTGLATESFTGPALVAVMAMKVRQMSVAASGVRDDEVTRLTKVPPFRVGAVRAMGRAWGQTRLADAIIELADLDAATKGGLRRGEYLDPVQKDAALEAFVVRWAKLAP